MPPSGSKIGLKILTFGGIWAPTFKADKMGCLAGLAGVLLSLDATAFNRIESINPCAGVTSYSCPLLLPFHPIPQANKQTNKLLLAPL